MTSPWGVCMSTVAVLSTTTLLAMLLADAVLDNAVADDPTCVSSNETCFAGLVESTGSNGTTTPADATTCDALPLVGRLDAC